VSSSELLPVNPEDVDYEREWRAKYKIMPDFENWLAFFADDLVMENEIPKPAKKEEVVGGAEPVPVAKGVKDGKNSQAAEVVDPNAIPVTFMRYVLDDELLPKQLYGVEDAKIQSVVEKSAFLYPDDNSMMRVDHF
jgi:hypothetical protein